MENISQLHSLWLHLDFADVCKARGSSSMTPIWNKMFLIIPSQEYSQYRGNSACPPLWNRTFLFIPRNIPSILGMQPLLPSETGHSLYSQYPGNAVCIFPYSQPGIFPISWECSLPTKTAHFHPKEGCPPFLEPQKIAFHCISLHFIAFHCISPAGVLGTAFGYYSTYSCG